MALTQKQETFQAAMRLKDLEVGAILTRPQLDSINHFLGDLLEAARKVKLQCIKITFDKEGKPICSDPNVEIQVTK